MGFDARDRESISMLADQISNPPEGTADWLAARILSLGLIRPQWWMRLGARFIAWRNKVSPFVAWLAVCTRFPGVAEEALEDAAAWALNGKDAHNYGVGGFDQAEVDSIAALLTIAQASRS